jgi:PAS domain S-box-containing protein
MSNSQNSANLHNPDRLQLRQIEAILDGMAEGLLIVDARGDVIRANPAASRILGLNTAGNLGSFEVRTLDGRLVAEQDLPVRRALRGETVSGLVLQIRREDTALHRIVSYSATPLPDEAGKISLAVLVLHDITEQKQAEAELQRMQDAIRRSQKDLQQFAFVASHDLQEPLRMVASYTQLLARKYQGQLGPDADEYIRYAVDGANRMSALIRDLLQFSRFGFAELQPPQSTDLSVMVDWALLGLQAAVQESGAEIMHGELPTVSVDQSQMPQVFQNLIGNAIKYRRAEEAPRVHISAKREGDEWTIAVRDNGIGFDPQHAGSLFGLFKRFHGREYSGSGIGLAICKRIVERHGGRIWATSQPGQGSTFYFTLRAD